MIEKTINVDRMDVVLNLFGNYDENINLIQRQYNVVILSRGSDIKITGEEENVYSASKAVEALITLANKGENINEQNIRYIFHWSKKALRMKYRILPMTVSVLQ